MADEGLPEPDELGARITEGILAPGSPFREILLRATKLKYAALDVVEAAAPLEDDPTRSALPAQLIQALAASAEAFSEPIP